MRPLPPNTQAIAVLLATDTRFKEHSNRWLDRLEQNGVGGFVVDLARKENPMPNLPGAASIKQVGGSDGLAPAPRHHKKQQELKKQQQDNRKETDNKESDPRSQTVETFCEDLLDFFARTSASLGSSPLCLIGYNVGALVAIKTLANSSKPTQKTQKTQKTYLPRVPGFSGPKELHLGYAMVWDLPDMDRSQNETQTLNGPRVLNLDACSENSPSQETSTPTADKAFFQEENAIQWLITKLKQKQ